MKRSSDWLDAKAACDRLGCDQVELYFLSEPGGSIETRKVNRGLVGSKYQYRRTDIEACAILRGRGEGAKTVAK